MVGCHCSKIYKILIIKQQLYQVAGKPPTFTHVMLGPSIMDGKHFNSNMEIYYITF